MKLRSSSKEWLVFDREDPVESDKVTEADESIKPLASPGIAGSPPPPVSSTASRRDGRFACLKACAVPSSIL